MFAWQKLVDDRGTRRDACDLRAVLKDSSLRREEMLLPGFTTPFMHGFLLAGVLFVLLWELLAGFLFPMLHDIAFFSWGGLALYGFLFVFPGTVLGIEMARHGWRSPQYAIDAMKRVGRCPSCAYRIDGVTPEGDGCTVCPECGGAWRLGDAGS